MDLFFSLHLLFSFLYKKQDFLLNLNIFLKKWPSWDGLEWQIKEKFLWGKWIAQSQYSPTVWAKAALHSMVLYDLLRCAYACGANFPRLPFVDSHERFSRYNHNASNFVVMTPSFGKTVRGQTLLRFHAVWDQSRRKTSDCALIHSFGSDKTALK